MGIPYLASLWCGWMGFGDRSFWQNYLYHIDDCPTVESDAWRGLRRRIAFVYILSGLSGSLKSSSFQPATSLLTPNAQKFGHTGRTK